MALVTFENERRHRKQRLAAGLRIFAKFGYDHGTQGHMTVRDPEETDHFWVNPFAMYFGYVRASDLLLVDSEGNVVVGERLVNSAAFEIHSRIHASRPDVMAVAHSHTLHGKAWSTLGRLLDPITLDSCAFFEDHGLYNGYEGVVLDRSEAENIVRALGSYKGVILRNHGLLTVGPSVDEAVWWFITMNTCCQAQLLAEAVGKPYRISDEVARNTREVVASPISGMSSFLPLWDWIVRLEPDLLE